MPQKGNKQPRSQPIVYGANLERYFIFLQAKDEKGSRHVRNSPNNQTSSSKPSKEFVSSETFVKIKRFVNEVASQLHEEDWMRLHLENGLDLLTFVQSLHRNPDNVNEAMIEATHRKLSLQWTTELSYLALFLSSVQFRPANVASLETCDKIEQFLDEVVPQMKPTDHPVTIHFNYARTLLIFYRNAHPDRWTPKYASVVTEKRGHVTEYLASEWTKVTAFTNALKENLKKKADVETSS